MANQAGHGGGPEKAHSAEHTSSTKGHGGGEVPGTGLAVELGKIANDFMGPEGLAGAGHKTIQDFFVPGEKHH